jgi:two-component system alkaline phosphatase synthesis response regulator PhoP
MAKKILIVDDDQDQVSSLAHVLKSNGYETIAAYSGSEGLKKLAAEKPDLIILDIMMDTDTEGFEIADMIRSSRPTSKYKEFKDTPIIMLTAINQATNSRFSLDMEESFLPGVEDFLTKPVNFDELIKAVQKYL